MSKQNQYKIHRTKQGKEINCKSYIGEWNGIKIKISL